MFNLDAMIFNFESITNRFTKDEMKKEYDLEKAIKEAKKDLEEARSYFDMVSDPDLIDHAIYLLEAAKCRYNYLIKQGRVIN